MMDEIEGMSSEQWREICFRFLSNQPKEKVLVFANFLYLMAYMSPKAVNDGYGLRPPKDIAAKLKKLRKSLKEINSIIQTIKPHYENTIAKPTDEATRAAIRDACRLGYSQMGKHELAQDVDAQEKMFTTFEDALVIIEIAIRENTMPGNAAHTFDQLERAYLSKNFVFRFRATFEEYPPITKEGKVAQLLGEVFKLAKLSDVNIEGQLKKAVKEARAGIAWIPKSRRKQISSVG